MPRKFDVAVMHDFYIDRLLYAGAIGGFADSLTAKAAEGGGGIHGARQEDVRGGNAVNLACALARLGLRTLLITHSDPAHEVILREAFEGLDAELRVKPRPTALTVALEGDVNVMLGDGKGASDFGPGLLDRSDWRALEDSRVVCSVNWAINRRGTELLLALRKRLGPSKPIFFDPADFRDRGKDFDDLLEVLLAKRPVDWVSMNEQEAAAAASALEIAGGDLGEMCRALAKRLGVVFDLHADKASYSSEGTRVSMARVSAVRPLRLTGAGDVWDAAAIYGRLRKMGEPDRLKFANAAARLYLKNRVAEPPTLAQVKGEL
ncbi:MAG: carbohydrate kinase family protein [Nitrososphaerota archaeon]|nr:carbohydrate kinase family protein [Nitrososphaerota archaeon]MDG7024515.1 carbohydrate kinase family protein [Nitrososphaerota archaeon]